VKITADFGGGADYFGGMLTSINHAAIPDLHGLAAVTPKAIKIFAAVDFSGH
jgi:hypothetical protein